MTPSPQLTELEDLLRHVVLMVLTIAAVATISFPALYWQFPWRKTVIGRALMLKSSATALAVNTMLLLVFWRPPFTIRYIIVLVAFSSIAVTSLRMAFIMYRANTQRETAPQEKNEVST